MDNALARTSCQGVCGNRQILGLLQGLGLEECEATLPNRSYVGIVGGASGLEGNVYDDGEVCQLIEMRD